MFNEEQTRIGRATGNSDDLTAAAKLRSQQTVEASGGNVTLSIISIAADLEPECVFA